MLLLMVGSRENENEVGPVAGDGFERFLDADGSLARMIRFLECAPVSEHGQSDHYRASDESVYEMGGTSLFVEDGEQNKWQYRSLRITQCSE
jgi:hypothetical protein